MKLEEVNNLSAYAVYKNMIPGVKVYQDTNQPANLKKRMKRQLQAKAKKEAQALAESAGSTGTESELPGTTANGNDRNVASSTTPSSTLQASQLPTPSMENGKKKNKRKRKSGGQAENSGSTDDSASQAAGGATSTVTSSDAPPTKLRKNMLPNPLAAVNTKPTQSTSEKASKQKNKKERRRKSKQDKLAKNAQQQEQESVSTDSNKKSETVQVKGKKNKNQVSLITNSNEITGSGSGEILSNKGDKNKDKNEKKASKSVVVAPTVDHFQEPIGTTTRIASLFSSKPVHDSVEHGKNLFQWLVSPTPTTKFMSDHWEKKPLHIKRNSTDPDYYKWILSSAKIDDIMRNHLIRFGKNIDVTSYTNGQRETHNPVGRAMPAAVWDYYSNGCSIRFLNPQTYVKPLWRLNALLQEYFGTFVGANVYLTPPDSQGFAPHYDDIEAFILQIEGKKHWKVYKPRVAEEELPRFSSGNFSEDKDNIGEPVLDVVLEEGDLLYFPRGWIHQANASDEHSLHITISCYQTNSWGDLMKEYFASAVDQAMLSSVNFRRGLPVDYLSYMGIVHQDSEDKNVIKKRQSFLKKTKNLVEELVTFTTPDLAADQLGKKFMWDSLPPYLTLKEKSTSSFSDGEFMDEGRVFNRCELDPDVEVKLVRKHCVRLVREENSLRLYFTLENSMEWHGEEAQFVEIPEEAEEGIKFLMAKYPEFIKIDELPMDDVTQKVQLIADLWERGIVVTNEPLVPVLDDDDFIVDSNEENGSDGGEEQSGEEDDDEDEDGSIDLEDDEFDEDEDFVDDLDDEEDDSEAYEDIEGDEGEGSVDGFEFDMGDSDSDSQISYVENYEDEDDDEDDDGDSQATDDSDDGLGLGKSYIEEITSGDEHGIKSKNSRPTNGLAIQNGESEDEDDDEIPPQLVSASEIEKIKTKSKKDKKKNKGKGKGKNGVAGVGVGSKKNKKSK